MIEKTYSILDGKKVAAIVCRPGLVEEELLFATPNEYPLQVGVNNRKKGTIVKAHKHKSFKQLTDLACQEIYYVMKGKMNVDLYNSKNEKFKVVEMVPGDLIVLNCGHGITVSEDCKFFEVKQGPYRGKEDEKEYF